MQHPEQNLAPMRVLSLMSGTSLDGIDAVVAELALTPEGLNWQVTGRFETTYEPDVRARLTQALKPESSDVHLLTELHTQVGQAYASLVQTIKRDGVAFDLVALSGQTVYHIPRKDDTLNWRTISTLQLGEASFVAEVAGVPVMSDFRQADMAAGGQGAPMVSFADLVLYGKAGVARSVHNLGGISNLTYLPATLNPDEVFAFDTGPANCLIDEVMQRHYGLNFDKDGQVAASGRVNERALADLLTHPYFAMPYPKTTGRETFTLTELESRYALSALSAPDYVATLVALTAESINQAYRTLVLPHGLDEILFAGGGALNPVLMDALQARLPVPVRTFEQAGWQSKDREALAFGVMAYYAYHGLPNTLPQATGAKHAVIAGKLSQSYRGAK